MFKKLFLFTLVFQVTFAFAEKEKKQKSPHTSSIPTKKKLIEKN